MADTVNTPGVLCFPDNSGDIGWRSVMPGFTDSCFPAAWLRVQLPAGQPAAFQWMEPPGVVASVAWGITVDKFWKFSKRLGLATISILAQFDPTTVGGNPATQILVDVGFLPDFGPNLIDQYTFDRINVSKITPWISDGCLPVVGGPGCASTGPLTLDWWPSACGIPQPGPTEPA